MSDVHIDRDSVASVAKTVTKISDEMPESVRAGRSGVAEALSGNAGSLAATALQESFDTWSQNHDLLTRQVASFGADLRSVVAIWDETEGTNTEAFERYGKGL